MRLDSYILWILINFKLQFFLFNAQCPAENGHSSINDGAGNCYVYRDAALTWSEADDVCLNEYNGALAQITSDTQLDFLQSFVNDSGARHVWLGAKQYYTGWTWTNGADTSEFSAWGDGSRHLSYNPSFTCANINNERNWDKFSCFFVSSFICEVETSSGNCHSSSDYVHVELSSRCFLIVQTQYLSWYKAADYCRNLSGMIAVLSSEQSNSAVQPSLLTEPWRRYWIGLRQSDYYWSTGNRVSTYYWAVSQPRSGGECVLFSLNSGDGYAWNTSDCEQPYPYVCQTGNATAIRLTENIPSVTPPTSTSTSAPPLTQNVNSDRTVHSSSTTQAPVITRPVRPEVVATQRTNNSPDPAVTAALVVIIVVIFGVLAGLLIFFYYYVRRNKILRKKARAEARLNPPAFPSPKMHNNNEENDDTPTSLFTTSFTSNPSNKQKTYNVTPQSHDVAANSTRHAQPNGGVKTGSNTNSRSSSVSSLHNAQEVAIPLENSTYEEMELSSKTNKHSKLSTELTAQHIKNAQKTDSEGTSGTDEAYSSRDKTISNTYNDSVLGSKRRGLGERSSRVRRSNSRVGPLVQKEGEGYENIDPSTTTKSLLSSTGSFRKNSVANNSGISSNHEDNKPDQSLPSAQTFSNALYGSYRGRGNALPPMELGTSDQPHPKPRTKKTKRKDQDTVDDERKHRNRDKKDQSEDDTGKHEGGVHFTSNDTAPDHMSGHSRRGRSSHRRARVIKDGGDAHSNSNTNLHHYKKKHHHGKSHGDDSESNIQTAAKASTAASDGYGKSNDDETVDRYTYHQKHSLKKETLSGSNNNDIVSLENVNEKPDDIDVRKSNRKNRKYSRNDFNSNRSKNEESNHANLAQDRGRSNKHDETLYLQTCNDISDDDNHVDIDSLPDDNEYIEMNQDVFV